MTASRRLGAALLVAAVAVPAFAAAPAAAATVEARIVEAVGESGLRYPEWRAIVRAAPGERNEIRVYVLDQDTMRVEDPRNPVVAGERCRSLDEHTADCAIPPDQPPVSGLSPYLSVAEVHADDGDDAVSVPGGSGPRLLADGGAGDDTLTGSELAGDELDGGGGRDRLFGRGNSDVLTDGDTSGSADDDVLDGGDDRDTVSYEGRTSDVRVDLAANGPAGERGERDGVFQIEWVTGGAGDDDLGGGPGLNLLEGGPGDDHLDGEGGHDQLFGGPGADRLHGHRGVDGLDGGQGPDQLRGDANSDFFYAPTSVDTVSCGRRGDTITNPTNLLVRRDCELRMSLTFDESGAFVQGENLTMVLEPNPERSRSGRSLRFAVGCTEFVGGGGTCGPSDGTLRLATAGGERLGSGRVANRSNDELEEPEVPTVVVRLTDRGRRVAARGGLMTASISGDRLPTMRWRVRAR